MVRSVLGVELYAFAEALDHAFILRHDLADILKVWVQLVLLIDSMTLFHLLIHTSTVSTEKRLVIDISALHDAF